MLDQENILKKTSVLINKKKYEEAKFTLLNFIKISKNIKIGLKFYYQLYQATYGLREFKNAKNYLEKCIKINGNNHIVFNNLANLFLVERNVLKAEKFYLKSIEKKNDYSIAYINLAILYEHLGKLEAAKKFYLKAIEIEPNQVSIYYNLNRIDKNFLTEDKINFLNNLQKKNEIRLVDKAYFFFLLAENERKKKSFNKEIDYLKKAHQSLFDADLNKNNQSLNYWINIIPNKYDKFTFKNENKINDLAKLYPILIIGLPRSGSTIVEAILSSGNTKVENLGETSMLNGALLSTHNLLTSNKNINLDLINNTIDQFMKDIKFYKIKNNIFTDKSLENFFYIEIILKIFPKAKFIHTFRNLEDNIFAIFQQALTKISWTNSIENILIYIHNYLKIINLFEKKYPEKIFSISLEKLTDDPKEISKKLYKFCDLKWDDKVLEFYNRKDLIISTASNIQVRKNIIKYNYKKYTPYKDFLKIFSNKYDWLV